jgi:hypothetical protein
LVSQQLWLYDLQRVGKHEIRPRGDKPHASPWLLDFLKSADLYWEGTTVRFGLILTGEKLVDNVDYRDQLKKFEPEAIGGEMEGAGLYTACQDAYVDWILVKAICDWADGNKGQEKEARQNLAAHNAASFVLYALQQASIKQKRESFAQGERFPSRPSSEASVSLQQDTKITNVSEPATDESSIKSIHTDTDIQAIKMEAIEQQKDVITMSSVAGNSPNLKVAVWEPHGAGKTTYQEIVYALILEFVIFLVLNWLVSQLTVLSVYINSILLIATIIIVIASIAGAVINKITWVGSVILIIPAITVYFSLISWQPWCSSDSVLFDVKLPSTEERLNTIHNQVTVARSSSLAIHAYNTSRFNSNEQGKPNCEWSYEGDGVERAKDGCSVLFETGNDNTTDLVNVRIARSSCNQSYLGTLLIKPDR